MSVETVHEFWQQVHSDPELAAKLLATETEPDLSEALKAIVDIAGTAGFQFTADEYRAAVDQQIEDSLQRAEELQEEDLAQVSGGGGIPSPGLSGAGPLQSVASYIGLQSVASYLGLQDTRFGSKGK